MEFVYEYQQLIGVGVTIVLFALTWVFKSGKKQPYKLFNEIHDIVQALQEDIANLWGQVDKARNEAESANLRARLAETKLESVEREQGQGK